jgi:hypothetical protein
MGQLELNAFEGLLGSNLGLVAGMIVALFGMYQLLVKQQVALGLILLFASCSIAFLPNLVQGIRVNLCPAVQILGGSCYTQ